MQLRPLPADEGQALAHLLLRLGVGLQRHPRLVDVRVALGGNEKKSISLFAFFFAKLGHENRTMCIYLTLGYLMKCSARKESSPLMNLQLARCSPLKSRLEFVRANWVAEKK